MTSMNEKKRILLFKAAKINVFTWTSYQTVTWRVRIVVMSPHLSSSIIYAQRFGFTAQSLSALISAVPTSNRQLLSTKSSDKPTVTHLPSIKQQTGDRQSYWRADEHSGAFSRQTGIETKTEKWNWKSGYWSCIRWVARNTTCSVSAGCENRETSSPYQFFKLIICHCCVYGLLCCSQVAEKIN